MSDPRWLDMHDPTNGWSSPSWCSYPGASRPVTGCWSLLGGKIKTASDCGDCECRLARQSSEVADD